MKQAIEKFFKWLVMSSVDPESVSLSVKGIFLMFIPGLMQFLTQIGVNVDANVFVHWINVVTGSLGIVLLAIGLFRKLFLGQETIVPVPPVEAVPQNTETAPTE